VHIGLHIGRIGHIKGGGVHIRHIVILVILIISVVLGHGVCILRILCIFCIFVI
jgi:hypothetical protein